MYHSILALQGFIYLVLCYGCFFEKVCVDINMEQAGHTFVGFSQCSEPWEAR